MLKNKWKKVKLVVLFSIVVIGIGCAGYKWVQLDGAINIQEIKINGLKILDHQTIKSVIGVDIHTSWEQVKVEDIELKVMGLDLVEAVKVEIGLDRVLKINIQEAEVIAMEYNNSWCWVYYNSYKKCNQKEPLDIPIVKINDKEDLPTTVKYLKDLKTNHVDIYNDLSMFVVEKGQANAFFNSHGLKVKLKLEPAKPWKKYKYLIENFPEKLTSKKTIDLRFKGYAYAS